MCRWFQSQERAPAPHRTAASSLHRFPPQIPTLRTPLQVEGTFSAHPFPNLISPFSCETIFMLAARRSCTLAQESNASSSWCPPGLYYTLALLLLQPAPQPDLGWWGRQRPSFTPFRSRRLAGIGTGDSLGRRLGLEPRNLHSSSYCSGTPPPSPALSS